MYWLHQIILEWARYLKNWTLPIHYTGVRCSCSFPVFNCLLLSFCFNQNSHNLHPASSPHHLELQSLVEQQNKLHNSVSAQCVSVPVQIVLVFAVVLVSCDESVTILLIIRYKVTMFSHLSSDLISRVSSSLIIFYWSQNSVSHLSQPEVNQ